MPYTELQPGSSLSRRDAWCSLGAVPRIPAPASPPPQPPMREVLPASAAGCHICNGLQGWPGLRLIPDVDSPGMCLLSNCPAPEGSRPLLFVHPCCTPVIMLGPSFFPTACAGTATAGTRANPVGGGAHSPPAWSIGLARAEVSAHPPSFFPGAKHWGQRGKLWKTH